MYITVTSANGRSFYLAKERIGVEGYTVVATFTSEASCQETAKVMNLAFDQRAHNTRTKART